jgi:hypothetical protein
VSDCRVLVRDICYLIFTVSDCRVLVRDICYLIFTVSDCRVLVNSTHKHTTAGHIKTNE